jgi:hypothetical protein
MTLQTRDKRAILILGVGVALYGLLSWVVLPAYDALTGAETAALERENLLEKYRQVTGRKGRYDALLHQAEQQQQQASTRVIQAANPSLAAVELQSLVEGVAQKLGIMFAQRSVLPPTPSVDTLREISMSLAFVGTPQQMVSFLTEVRALPKSVRILTMNVTPVQVAQEAPKGSPFSKDVRVSLTLGAWVQLPQAAQPPSKGGN